MSVISSISIIRTTLKRCLLIKPLTNYPFIRGYCKKKDPRKNDELQEDVDFGECEIEDEIAETVDDGLPVDYKVKTIKAPNRRLETIVKRVAKKGNALVFTALR